MSKIFVNGCFDLLHEGHIRFLKAAKNLGGFSSDNYLIVALNSDKSARRLKAQKWGSQYPIDSEYDRFRKASKYADEVWWFESETDLRRLIRESMPCILVKGPDYLGMRVTGDDIAPVIILDTYETEEIRQLKLDAYSLNTKSIGQPPTEQSLYKTTQGK